MFFTTSETNKHRHLGYWDEAGSTGEVGRVKKHKHELRYLPESGGFMLVAAKDGHTHYVEDIRPEEIPDSLPELRAYDPDTGTASETETEEDIVTRKYNQFDEAYDAELDSIDRGQESVDFREGKQWPEAVKAELEGNNRAAVTINHVAPAIETLSGIARQQRTDIKIFPVEGGDQFTADVLTQSIKQILAQNEYEYEEIEMFEDEISAGRGAIAVYPSFDNNLEGEIKIRHVPWDMFTVAPHRRKDLEDAEYVFRWEWVSHARLTNLYPEKKQEIRHLYDKLERSHQYLKDDTMTRDSVLLNPVYANSKSRQLRLLECEEKEYYTVKVYIHLNTAEAVSENELPKDLKSQLSTLDSLAHVTRRLFRVRKTVVCGDIIFEDQYLDVPARQLQSGNPFSLLVAYAYKRGLYFEGKIERMKDPQLELNKRRSQTIDIVNTCINNGWFYEEGTFQTPNDEEDFRENVSKAGFTQKIENIERPPMKVASNAVDRAVVDLEANSRQSIREISNINSELLGQAPSYQSGIALQNQQRQALTGNEYLFDNMNRAKKELGRRLVGWIQKLYSPQRVARLVLNQAVIDKVFIAGEQLDPQNQQQVQQFMQRVDAMLSNADLINYDVAIGEANSTPTTQLSNLQLMHDLARAGVPIPPLALLEMAPIPNKEVIMQYVQQQMQAEQDIERSKQETEIRKTQIAHGQNQSPSQGSTQ